MKKMLIIGAILGASVVGVAGCGGSGTGEEGTTTVSSSSDSQTETTGTETTTNESTTGSAATSDPSTTEAVTTTASETTTSADSGSSENSAGGYTLVVNKSPEGFSSSGDLSFSSATAEYSYKILNDTTNHSIESMLDNEASKLTDGTTGKVGDVMYAKGKTDFGNYSITAYNYIGSGDSVSAFAGIEYLSEEDISAAEVAALLSDDYISVSR